MALIRAMYDTQKLVRARYKKGWNQTTLAFHAGLSVATVSLIESGKRSTPKAVNKMAVALGLNVADLVIEAEEGVVMRKGSVRDLLEEPPKKGKKAS